MITLGKEIKKEFPIFNHHPDLVYLDSAATALKPQCVIDAMNKYYTEYSANVHRGIYALSNRATAAYEQAREDVASFIGAHSSEIIFTRNATEAINLVAHSWVRRHPLLYKEGGLPKGDGVVRIGLSIAEHHSNIVPWQQLTFDDTSSNPSLTSPQPSPCKGEGDDDSVPPSIKRGLGGVSLRYLEVDAHGELIIPKNFFNEINFLALTHVSNVLGTINPIKEIIQQAHQHNVPVLIDASQSVPHMKIDVGDLDCDFLVFSGHKLGGPTGIGVLYAKSARMQEMEPFLTGGDMIREVHRDYSVWNDAPYKFEAGTPHIAGAIGLGAAVNWLRSLGFEDIRKHEEKLLSNISWQLSDIKFENRKLKTENWVLGPRDISKRSGLVSFNLPNIHPHDVAQFLDEQNIAIRAGHQCAMPLHEYLGLVASCRASVWVYNTEDDVQKFVEGLYDVVKKFV
ncbi:MAG TPA: aminotransferase class V-fold PLP-dependent enzyme [Patescibacteria group bacterium]|nr:aminotransferase class V-fold PLP-dependent enzyme [Patescibacteria group bacterium]